MGAPAGLASMVCPVFGRFALFVVVVAINTAQVLMATSMIPVGLPTKLFNTNS